jgi:hypothetical protein
MLRPVGVWMYYFIHLYSNSMKEVLWPYFMNEEIEATVVM